MASGCLKKACRDVVCAGTKMSGYWARRGAEWGQCRMACVASSTWLSPAAAQCGLACQLLPATRLLSQPVGAGVQLCQRAAARPLRHHQQVARQAVAVGAGCCHVLRNPSASGAPPISRYLLQVHSCRPGRPGRQGAPGCPHQQPAPRSRTVQPASPSVLPVGAVPSPPAPLVSASTRARPAGGGGRTVGPAWRHTRDLQQ